MISKIDWVKVNNLIGYLQNITICSFIRTQSHQSFWNGTKQNLVDVFFKQPKLPEIHETNFIHTSYTQIGRIWVLLKKKENVWENSRLKTIRFDKTREGGNDKSTVNHCWYYLVWVVLDIEW